MDIFKGAGVVPLIEGVVGEGRDGLLATLGVTGSGKVRISDLYEISFKYDEGERKSLTFNRAIQSWAQDLSEVSPSFHWIFYIDR